MPGIKQAALVVVVCLRWRELEEDKPFQCSLFASTKDQGIYLLNPVCYTLEFVLII